MSSNHTPGPWTCGDGYFLVGPHAGMTVAILADSVGSQMDTAAHASTTVSAVERLANCRLVAAAPELLAVLRDLLIAESREGRLTPQQLGKARAAIAKASDEGKEEGHAPPQDR